MDPIRLATDLHPSAIDSMAKLSFAALHAMHLDVVCDYDLE